MSSGAEEAKQGKKLKKKFGGIPEWPKGADCKSVALASMVRIHLPPPIFNGRIAQLGEHLPYKQGVTGSSPVVPTIKNKIYAGMAQR